MRSKEVYEYIQTNKVENLYKKMESCFELIDTWSDRLVQENLLDEYELSHCMDVSTGVYAKLASVVGALDAYMNNLEYNTELKEYNEVMKANENKVKTTDTPIVKAKARSAVSDVRGWLSDFQNYLNSAEKIILTCQSRIKRLTLEKTARGVDWTGDASNIPTSAGNEGW